MTDDLDRLLALHHDRSRELIHLVPSENSMAAPAHAAYLTDALYRYTFTPPDGENWSWPGTDLFGRIERKLLEDLRVLYRCEHVDVRPISGINAMTAVLAALHKRAGTVYSVPVRDGGHGATAQIARYIGFRTCDLPYDPVTMDLDLAELGRAAGRWDEPAVLYLDQFMCLFPLDIAGIRRAVGERTVIHFDGSHVMGLLSGGQFQDPLREGADAVSGSMHKTFPGPHKAIIFTNDPVLAADYSDATNAFVSHRHTADMIALAYAADDMLTRAPAYAELVVTNARFLAEELVGLGVHVLGAARGYTRSHQLWIDTAPHLSAVDAARTLFEHGVVVNAIEIPYLADRLGVRIGVQEVTNGGLANEHMPVLARLLAATITGRDAVHAERHRRELLDVLADHRREQARAAAPLFARLLG